METGMKGLMNHQVDEQMVRDKRIGIYEVMNERLI